MSDDEGTDPRPPVRVGRNLWEKGLRRSEGLDSTAKLVGYAVATWSSTKSGADARPGIKRMMLATAKSETTVWRALRRLRDAQWLEIVNVGEREARRDLAWQYQLTVPAQVFDELSRDTSNDAPLGVAASGHPRPVGTDATVQWAPVQEPVVAHAQSQAHDHHRTGTTREPGLPGAQLEAAQTLFARLAPAVSELDAIDCIRQLVARRRPPDDVRAYTRGFDAASVIDLARKHRGQGTTTSAANSWDSCPHGVTGGQRQLGVGEHGSLHCPKCQQDLDRREAGELLR